MKHIIAKDMWGTAKHYRIIPIEDKLVVKRLIDTPEGMNTKFRWRDGLGGLELLDKSRIIKEVDDERE